MSFCRERCTILGFCLWVLSACCAVSVCAILNQDIRSLYGHVGDVHLLTSCMAFSVLSCSLLGLVVIAVSPTHWDGSWISRRTNKSREFVLSYIVLSFWAVVPCLLLEGFLARDISSMEGVDWKQELEQYYITGHNCTRLSQAHCAFTRTLNNIQLQHTCCGVESHQDYLNVTGFVDQHGRQVPVHCFHVNKTAVDADKKCRAGACGSTVCSYPDPLSNPAKYMHMNANWKSPGCVHIIRWIEVRAFALLVLHMVTLLAQVCVELYLVAHTLYTWTVEQEKALLVVEINIVNDADYCFV